MASVQPTPRRAARLGASPMGRPGLGAAERPGREGASGPRQASCAPGRSVAAPAPNAARRRVAATLGDAEQRRPSGRGPRALSEARRPELRRAAGSRSAKRWSGDRGLSSPLPPRRSRAPCRGLPRSAGVAQGTRRAAPGGGAGPISDGRRRAAPLHEVRSRCVDPRDADYAAMSTTVLPFTCDLRNFSNTPGRSSNGMVRVISFRWFGFMSLASRCQTCRRSAMGV